MEVYLLVLGLLVTTTTQTPRREVAITYDDVPGIQVVPGQCNYKSLERLNRSLIDSLSAHRIPATGLVVESNLCNAKAGELASLLSMWLDAGLELGNHSYSHFDLNNTPLAKYQADVVRGEATLAKLLKQRGQTIKYFRHPFLHAGKDLPTKRAFEQWLTQRGYQLAPVTIDNQEWIFAMVYARALGRNDKVLMQRVGTAYVAYMEEIFAFFEQRSVEVAGREIRQVLLLHANQLNVDYFDELFQMMERRGYTFVPLARALEDPAYRMPDNYAGPVGYSWLHRWALTRDMKMKSEPSEPQWVRKLFEAR